MRTALLAVSMLLAAAPAFAAWGDVPIHSDPEIGGRSVFYRPKDADHGTWAPGGQVRGSLGGAYGYEMSLDYTRHTAAGADYRVIPVQLTLLGFFSPETPMSAYLLAGVGWYFTKLGGPGAHSETLFREHAGVGLHIMTQGSLTVDGSWRYIWSSVWRFNDYGHPWGSGYHFQGTMITLAANYRL